MKARSARGDALPGRNAVPHKSRHAGQSSGGILVLWRHRLSQPSAGHTIIMAVSPLFVEWLDRPHGVLTFHMTQVLTGHGQFARFLYRIRADKTPGCYHCVDRREDTMEHTVEVCSAWAEQRHVLVGWLGGSDLSRRALVLVMVMVRCEEEWQAVASFYKAVMLTKEAAASARQWPSHPSRRDFDPDFRPP